jgi:hypothetical protein
MLNGSVYQFTGVNAYEIATDWGTDADHGNSPLSIIESPQVIARVG